MTDHTTEDERGQYCDAGTEAGECPFRSEDHAPPRVGDERWRA